MLSRKMIENTLLEIGVPAGVKGFRYITDEIMLIDEHDGANIKFIKVYEQIAKDNNTNGSLVERAIRHALKAAREGKWKSEKTIHYIGDKTHANGNSLMMLYMRLKDAEERTKTEEESTEEMIRRIVREELRSAAY